MKATRCVPVIATLALSLVPATLMAQQGATTRPAEFPNLLPIATEPAQGTQSPATQPPASQQRPPVRPAQPPQNAPQNTPNAAQPDAAAFARANEAVASAPRSLTPGVFGDQFGGNSLKIFRLNGQEGTPQTLDGVTAALPSSLIGRFKVAENNSPAPADRVYFNYNFFTSTIYGVDVSRFTAGIEKSFFDGRASVELRLPFASTLDNQQISDFGTIGAINGMGNRLGDLQIVTKMVVAQSDTWLFGGGLGISVPTAPDYVVNNTTTGNNLLEIGNESVHLQPYLSFLYSPDDRFYFQGFTGIDIDLNGDPVRFASFSSFPDGQLTQVGRLRDRTFWTTDVAVGYWVYRNQGSSLITGLAPQFEVHWNQALDKVNTVTGDFNGIAGDSYLYNNLNLGAILNVEIRNNSRLALGFVFPVTGTGYHDFNAEFGVLFNYHF